MRRFAYLRLCKSIPDETTILNFRHYIEAHKFGKKIFETINQHLADQGLKLREGTIVDATIIAGRHPPKIPVVNGIQKCIRLKRAMNGIME